MLYHIIPSGQAGNVDDRQMYPYYIIFSLHLLSSSIFPNVSVDQLVVSPGMWSTTRSPPAGRHAGSATSAHVPAAENTC